MTTTQDARLLISALGWDCVYAKGGRCETHDLPLGRKGQQCSSGIRAVGVIDAALIKAKADECAAWARVAENGGAVSSRLLRKQESAYRTPTVPKGSWT